MVEFSDVYICGSPRSEADWEEGPAKQRAQAAKEAQLIAAELEKATQPTDKTQGSGDSRSYGWSLVTHLGTLLLRGLQLSIHNLHICFKVGSPSDAPCLLEAVDRSSPPFGAYALLQNAQSKASRRSLTGLPRTAVDLASSFWQPQIAHLSESHQQRLSKHPRQGNALVDVLGR